MLQLRESVAKQRKEWVEISNLEELQVVDNVAVQCKDWKQASAGNLHFPTAAVSVFSLCWCFCEIGMFVYFALLCRGSMSLFRNWGNFHNQAKTFLIEQ